jgi:hypothetical protein
VVREEVPFDEAPTGVPRLGDAVTGLGGRRPAICGWGLSRSRLTYRGPVTEISGDGLSEPGQSVNLEAPRLTRDVPSITRHDISLFESSENLCQ